MCVYVCMQDREDVQAQPATLEAEQTCKQMY